MKSIFVTIVFAALALAQSSGSSSSSAAPPLGTADISGCIQNCSNAAATKNGCSNFADIPCVCSSAQFQFDAGSCLQANCPDQLQAARAAQAAVCGTLTPSGQVSSTPFTNTAVAPTNTGGATGGAPSASNTLTTPSNPSPSPSTSGTAPASSPSNAAVANGVNAAAVLGAVVGGLLL